MQKMFVENKDIRHTKIILVFIASLVFIFASYNLYTGSKLIGKTFSGFGLGINIIFSPMGNKEWTGYKTKIPIHNKISEVDGIKINSIEHFKQIIESKQPNTEIEYTFEKNGVLEKDKIKTMLFSKKVFWETYGFSYFISLFYFIISIFIIYNYKANDSKIKTLLLFTLLFTASCASFYDSPLNHKLSSINYSLEILTVASLVQLGLYMNKNNFGDKNTKKLINLNIIISLILSVMLLFLEPFVKGNIFQYPILTELFLITFKILVNYIALCFLIFAILSSYAYFKSKNYSLERNQSRIIFTGNILAFSPYFILWFIPTLFGYQASLQNIFIFFALFPISIVYSIVRYKAFDIEFFIRKGLIYASLTLALALAYFIFSTIGFLFLKNYLSLNQDIYIAVSAILATLITGQLKEIIQNSIDKAFYREKFDLSILLQEFLSEINRIFDKKDLFSTSVFYLEKTINPLFINLYIPDKTNRLQLLTSGNNSSINNGFFLDLNTRFQTNQLNEDFLDIDSSLVMPLKNENNTIGILVLGEKKSEIEYLFEEKNFLKNFGTSLSMALNNLNLKEKTISLVVEKMELESKANFLRQLTSTLSHDLKHPLSSAYIIADRIKYYMEKKNFRNEYIENGLTDLNKSLKKLNDHISIVLDRELISLGKLVLQLEPVSIKKIINDAIFIHSNNINANEIELKYNAPEFDILVSGDSLRLENVISNLLSNAIKYGDTEIIIDLEVRDKNLLIKLSDNGSGVDDEFKNQIFECYSKADTSTINSGKDRSTGLGLFICKNYLDLMNGKIYFETEKNKGTTFFIELPILEIVIDKSLDLQEKIKIK
ncbi:MAG: ATP-binding protein [Candidatus Sericytochromatia bacterium]